MHTSRILEPVGLATKIYVNLLDEQCRRGDFGSEGAKTSRTSWR